MDNIKIRCPRCNWEPDDKPYWRCDCGYRWNTFSTGGRCPACKKVHEYTQCPPRAGGCNKWSPHLDWYEGLDNIVNALKESIKEAWKEVMT
jgi:hypothetical protein